MCGIAGKYNLDGKPVSKGLIEEMCSRIVHRGPDDGGVYVDGNIGLGHRRLSIIDLSNAGHQPMSTADSTLWITYNGEIYNFKSLRMDLERKGYSFISNCDTEVILYMYREYGQDCLEYFRGMFAFAIWDSKNQKLFIARDRIGKKPLYYYFDGNAFVFASEIKSILADQHVQREINYEAFYDYFKYLYVPAPKTIYRNIFKLEPGYCLSCSKEGMKKYQYWDISFATQNSGNEHAIADELLQTLSESVGLRMISDVPLGAFLSGGIDSSAVVALMAQQKQGPVTTCSIGFDSDKYDEVVYSRKVASLFNTDHHEYTVKQNIEDVLPKLAYHFDEPFADSSSVPTYYVSKIARQNVTVALSGDGGDENFAGYEKYYIDDIENSLRKKTPSLLRKTLFPHLAGMLYRFNNVTLRKTRTLLNTLSYEADHGFYLTNTEIEGVLFNEIINDDTRGLVGDYDPSDITKKFYAKADTDDHLSKILYTDMKTYLAEDILMKVDKMSMANSLEVRAPILDHKVIEFAASIPPQMKYKQREKKYILKRAFNDILPQDVMYRKKMGFSVPLSDWFCKEIKDFAYLKLFSNDAGTAHFFRKDKLQKLWDLHQSGTRNYATVLWSILMFELWYREFMQ